MVIQAAKKKKTKKPTKARRVRSNSRDNNNPVKSYTDPKTGKKAIAY